MPLLLNKILEKYEFLLPLCYFLYAPVITLS